MGTPKKVEAGSGEKTNFDVSTRERKNQTALLSEPCSGSRQRRIESGLESHCIAGQILML